MSAFWGQLPSLVALAAHAAICVTGVSVVGATALWICRGRSAPLRHALALSFLAATLVIPAIAALYQYRLIRFSFARAPQSPTITDTNLVRETGSAAAPIEEDLATTTSQNTARNWSFVACAAFGLVWVAGCAVGCVRMVRVNHRQRQYLAPLRPVAKVAALELVDRLRQALGIRRAVQLLTSRDSPWPFTVGLFRPRVIVPGELLQECSQSRLESVLLHELAHVRRCDCGIAGVEEVARLLYWWNPLVSMLTSQLAAAREEICDGYVLAHAGDGASLAKYLLSSAEKAAHAQLRFAVGLSWHDPLSLRRRITQLLAGDRNTMTRLNSLSAGSLSIASFIVAVTFIHANFARAALIFGPAVNVGAGVSTAYGEGPTEISADGLTLYFASNRPPDTHVKAYRAERTSALAAWSGVAPLAELNTPHNWGIRWVSGDQLTALSSRDGTDGIGQILELSRQTNGSPWTIQAISPSPINLPGYSSANPTLYADQLRMIFHSNRLGGLGDLDLWEASRSQIGDSWTVTNLGSDINSASNEGSPYVSRDGLFLFFSSNRPGGLGDMDIWMSERASINEPWGTPTNLGPSINNSANQGVPVYWSEGGTLFFRSNGHGGLGLNEIMSASVIPEPPTDLLIISGSVLLATCMVNHRRK